MPNEAATKVKDEDTYWEGQFDLLHTGGPVRTHYLGRPIEPVDWRQKIANDCQLRRIKHAKRTSP